MFATHSIYPPRRRGASYAYRGKNRSRFVLLFLLLCVALGLTPTAESANAGTTDENRFQELDYSIKQWQSLAKDNPRMTVPADLEQNVLERSILANKLALATVAQAEKKTTLEISAASKSVIDVSAGLKVASQAMDASLEYLEGQKSMMEAWGDRYGWDKDVLGKVLKDGKLDDNGKAELQRIQKEVHVRLGKVKAEIQAVRNKQAAIRKAQRQLSSAMSVAGIVDKVRSGDAVGATQGVLDLGKEYADEGTKNRLDIASGGLATAQKLASGDVLGAAESGLEILNGQLPDYSDAIANDEGFIGLIKGSRFYDSALKKQAGIELGKTQARLNRMRKVQSVKQVLGTATDVLGKAQTAINFVGKAKEFLDVMSGKFPTSPGASAATARLVGGMKLTGEAVKSLADWLPPGLKQTVGQVLEAYADALIAGPSILERMSLMFANEECENNKGWSTGSVAARTFNEKYNACMKFTPEFKRNVSLYVNSRTLDDYPDYVFVPDMGKEPQIIDKQTYKRLADIASAYTAYATILDQSFSMNDETVASILQAIKSGSPTFTVNDWWFFDTTITIKDIEEDTAILLELRSALGDRLTKDNARDMIKRWKTYLSDYAYVKKYCQLALFDSPRTRQRFFVMYLENRDKLHDTIERQLLFADRATPECKASFVIHGPTKADAGQTIELNIAPGQESDILRQALSEGKATWFADGAKVGQGLRLRYRPQQPGRHQIMAKIALDTTLGPRAYATREHLVTVADAETPPAGEAGAEEPGAPETQDTTPPSKQDSGSQAQPATPSASTPEAQTTPSRTTFPVTQGSTTDRGMQTASPTKGGTSLRETAGAANGARPQPVASANTPAAGTTAQTTPSQKTPVAGTAAQTTPSPTATPQSTAAAPETGASTTPAGATSTKGSRKTEVKPDTQTSAETGVQKGTTTDACDFLIALPEYLFQVAAAHNAVYEKHNKACMERLKQNKKAGKKASVFIASTDEEDVCADACFNKAYKEKHAKTLREIEQLRFAVEKELAVWRSAGDPAARAKAAAVCQKRWDSRSAYFAQYPKAYALMEKDGCGTSATSDVAGVKAPDKPEGKAPTTGKETAVAQQEKPAPEATKKVRVVLRQTAPAGSNVKLGATAAFSATVTVDGKPAGKDIVLRWEPLGNDGVRFSKPEGAGQTSNQATFLRPGPVRLWVTALGKKGNVLSTLGESNQVGVTVQNPELSLTASPASPLVGQEVVLALHETPKLPDNAFAIAWDVSGPTKSPGETSDKRGYSFQAAGLAPITVTARVKSLPYGEDLGQARIQITPRPYKVTVTDTLHGKPVAPHQDVTLQSSIAPTPPKSAGELRYAWSLSEGCRAFNTTTRDIRAQRSDAGSCSATVEIRDGHDIVLGTGSGGFSVVEQAAPKEDKELKRLLENAQKYWVNGDEQAACDAATQALGHDGKAADAKAAKAKYCDNGAVRIDAALKEAVRRMDERKFDEAQQAINTAKQINPRSQNVRSKESELADRRRKDALQAAEADAREKAVNQAIVSGAQQCRQQQWETCIQTLDKALADAPADFPRKHPEIIKKVQAIKTAAQKKITQKQRQEQKNKAALEALTQGTDLFKRKQWEACVSTVDKAMAGIDPELVKAKPELFKRVKQMRDQAMKQLQSQQNKQESDATTRKNEQKETASSKAACEKVYDKGYNAYQNQDFSAACRLFQAAIDCDPSNEHYKVSLNSAQKKGIFKQAMEKASNGDHRGAIKDYERVLQMRPNDCNAMHNLGSSLLQLGKNEEALVWINRAIKCNPGSSLFKNNAKIVQQHIATLATQKAQSSQRPISQPRSSQTANTSVAFPAGHYQGGVQGPATGTITFRIAQNGEVQGEVRGTYQGRYSYTGRFSGNVRSNGAFSCQLRGAAGGWSFTGQVQGTVAHGVASGSWQAQSGSTAPRGSWRANKNG